MLNNRKFKEEENIKTNNKKPQKFIQKTGNESWCSFYLQNTCMTVRIVFTIIASNITWEKSYVLLSNGVIHCTQAMSFHSRPDIDNITSCNPKARVSD